MIVIPPTDESKKYFTDFSNRAWASYIKREPSTELEMKRDHKTLAISCDITMDNDIVKVKLHYRYLKDKMYCFVEEV
jgi:hypothetical protein